MGARARRSGCCLAFSSPSNPRDEEDIARVLRLLRLFFSQVSLPPRIATLRAKENECLLCSSLSLSLSLFSEEYRSIGTSLLLFFFCVSEALGNAALSFLLVKSTHPKLSIFKNQRTRAHIHQIKLRPPRAEKVSEKERERERERERESTFLVAQLTPFYICANKTRFLPFFLIKSFSCVHVSSGERFEKSIYRDEDDDDDDAMFTTTVAPFATDRRKLFFSVVCFETKDVCDEC